MSGTTRDLAEGATGLRSSLGADTASRAWSESYELFAATAPAAS